MDCGDCLEILCMDQVSAMMSQLGPQAHTVRIHECCYFIEDLVGLRPRLDHCVFIPVSGSGS